MYGNNYKRTVSFKTFDIVNKSVTCWDSLLKEQNSQNKKLL